MRSYTQIVPAFLSAFLIALAGLPPASAGGESLRVGMVQTFFHDLSAPLIEEATGPFGKLMQETTGLTGELVVGGDPFTVARQLDDGKLQLGVFHGFEFAWVRQKHPELRPLMVASNAKTPPQSYVLVTGESPAAGFADLKGKDVAVPKRSKEYSRRFVERLSREQGAAGAKEFFGRVVVPANTESALDELRQGKFHAAVVDAYGLEFYRDLKPGVFAKLKVLAQSDAFAPTVVAYKQGALPEATRKRVLDGLRTAHKTETGRDMMQKWKITSFEPVPADFDALLAASLKALPTPEAKE